MSALPGYVLKNKRTTLERAEKFISSIYFTDCNLYGRLYPKRSSLKSIRHFASSAGRISHTDAVNGNFVETKVGNTFGPSWSTHWFQLEIEIPEDWLGEEVRLAWDSESEAMVWKDGVPLQGLSPENKRRDYIITKNLTMDERKHTLFVEMACNGLFGTGDNGQINPPRSDCQFKLAQAELVVLDRHVYALMTDLQILIDMVKFLPEDSNRGYQALYTANSIINTIQIGSQESYIEAHKIATTFFNQKNGESQHTIMAVGHCHIDTAWLWPYDETKRKCARSFSSVIRLMEDYPDFTFACSQAQQFDWVKQLYPQLYDQICSKVKEGRFIPVGGVWVELDGNLPSGESFVRQFLLGQKFFEKEFGILCKEFWLPDTFGYSAQLPQIMKLSGIERFVTQKLSWSLVNKFPHHTFWWSGIDGSKVLAHFPPGDSYNMRGNVEEVMKTVNNFQDKGRSNCSMFLYGYGDGGQGPTENMIERLSRMADVDGLPKVEFSTPDRYFSRVEAEEDKEPKLCQWSGELYLELHNGTYTSQAKVKQNNRRCEFLLTHLEIVSSLAWVSDTLSRQHQNKYPSDELDRLWKLVLLNQFHDVLPGSSINMVYKDAQSHYKDVMKSANSLLTKALEDIICCQTPGDNTSVPVVINTSSWPRTEVIDINSDHLSAIVQKNDILTQQELNGGTLVLAEAPSLGFAVIQSNINSAYLVTIEKGVLGCLGDRGFIICQEYLKDSNIYVQNGLLEAIIDEFGRIVGLYLPGSKKNAIATGSFGNQLAMFDDIPLYWDAWDVMDYHLETRKPVESIIQHAMIIEEGPLRATVEVALKLGDLSYMKQWIILDANCPYLKFKTEVHWHESHKFLKVEFPLNIVAPHATYEIQFGHLQRPTHFNTSWDWAKFEVCGHKWADVSEYDFGVAVLNDSKYGWSCIGNNLRLSLLRSPKAPDPTADMGVHNFTYAVMPHKGTFQQAGVIQAAYQLNSCLHVANVALAESVPRLKSFINIDQPSVILETLKMAEDKSSKLIGRFYEAYGGHTTAKVQLHFPVQAVQICNLLEKPELDASLPLIDGAFELNFSPFQIISVLLII